MLGLMLNSLQSVPHTAADPQQPKQRARCTTEMTIMYRESNLKEASSQIIVIEAL